MVHVVPLVVPVARVNWCNNSLQGQWVSRSIRVDASCYEYNDTYYVSYTEREALGPTVKGSLTCSIINGLSILRKSGRCGTDVAKSAIRVPGLANFGMRTVCVGMREW